MAKESRLKDLRKEAEMTLEELGEKLGTSRQSVSNWEFDLGTVSLNDAVKIAKLFNVTLDYLAGIDDNPRQVDIVKAAIKKIDVDALGDFVIEQNKK